MRAWCLENPIDGRYMFLSSVDHFCFDVPGYKWVCDEDGDEIIVAMRPEEIEAQEARREERAAEELADAHGVP